MYPVSGEAQPIKASWKVGRLRVCELVGAPAKVRGDAQHSPVARREAYVSCSQNAETDLVRVLEAELYGSVAEPGQTLNVDDGRCWGITRARAHQRQVITAFVRIVAGDMDGRCLLAVAGRSKAQFEGGAPGGLNGRGEISRDCRRVKKKTDRLFPL